MDATEIDETLVKIYKYVYIYISNNIQYGISEARETCADVSVWDLVNLWMVGCSRSCFCFIEAQKKNATNLKMQMTGGAPTQVYNYVRCTYA